MAVEVKPRHQDDTINGKLPLLGQHDLGLGPERTRADTLVPRLLSLAELLRLGEQNTNAADGNGDPRRDPEHDLEGVGVAADTEVGARREDISERITLLKNTRHKTSCFDGAVLERHGDCVAIYTAHEETEEGSNSEELPEVLAVYRRDLEQPQDPHVHHHGPLPPKPIPQQSKYRGTHTPQQQRERNRTANIRIRRLEVARQLDRLNGQGMEIERVGRPGGQSDDEEQPALRGELHE